MKRSLFSLAVALLGLGSAMGAERHSNGLGGGPWTDPGTWHDKVVPGATDVVVIASGDTLQLDAETAACGGLLIDPDGVLTARPDDRARLLRLTGSLESYGLIRIDATRSRGRLTIRIETDEPAKRAIQLFRHAGLLVYGAKVTEDGQPGVSLEMAMAGGAPAPGVLTAGPGVQLDLSAVRLANVAVLATGLDNTGFKPGERLNISDCRFEGFGRVELRDCDSALVAGNRFAWNEPGEAPAPAVATATCKLTDLRLNGISGRFPVGIDMGAEIDGAVTSNTVEQAGAGFSFRSCANLMLRADAAVGCGNGLVMTSGSGAVEGFRVKGAARGIVLVASKMQLADVRIEETPENGVPFVLESSSADLLNVNVTTNQIRRSGAAPAGGEAWVTILHYVVVKAGGKAPPGSEVAVATAAASGGPPGGLADLNVRNSPARILSSGLTPLPRTLRPLVVRGWRIDGAGVFRAAPFYDLKVMGPPDPGTGQRPVLKAQVIEPRDSWYRPEPDAPAPTLEVTW
jgi:hypothetical protein